MADGGVWKTLKTETVSGHTCELRYSEAGKGRTKMKFWRMFIDGEYFTYASVERDVETNWRYTLAHAAKEN